jgi:parallel beta-helix repeat protein
MKRSKLAWTSILVCLVFQGHALAATLNATPDSDLNQLAAKLKPGDTLHLKAGVYRQTLEISGLRGTPDAPIVIEGEAAGSIIRASDVLKRWKPAGPNLYLHALPKETSQVFLDGTAMKQIGGTVFDGYPVRADNSYHALHKPEGVWPGRIPDVPLAQLPNNSFWYDRDNKTLYLKTTADLSQAVVEASVRTRTIEGNDMAYVQFKDLKVQHANTSVVSRGGSMTVNGRSLVITRVAAEWNDLIGLGIGGSDVKVSDVLVAYNGQAGMAGRGYNHLIQRVTATYNNRRGFNKWWEAGGFKFVGDGGLQNSVVENCVAQRNNGDGIWFDWKNQNVDVRRNIAAYNAGFGIHFEVSGPSTVQHNVAIGNTQRGIFLTASHHMTVNNNLAVANGMQGITSVLEDRKDLPDTKFRANGNRFFKNVLAWNTDGALYIPDTGDEQSNFNVIVGKGKSAYFSREFPHPLRLPSKGLSQWNENTGQDLKSWQWDIDMPESWKSYLSVGSSDVAPLAQLLREVRKQPPAEDVTLGADHRVGKVRVAIPDVGPDWIQ